MATMRDLSNTYLPIGVVVAGAIALLTGGASFLRGNADERVQSAVTNAQTAARLGVIEATTQKIQADALAQAALVDSKLERLLATMDNRMGTYVSQTQMMLWIARARSANIALPDFP